jgi:hypothetical protein
MVLDPMERMVLFDSSFLSLGDVRLQEEAPPDDSDEQIEQDDLDASDDQFQVPMGLVVDEMPERFTVFRLESPSATPKEPIDERGHEQEDEERKP